LTKPSKWRPRADHEPMINELAVVIKQKRKWVRMWLEEPSSRKERNLPFSKYLKRGARKSITTVERGRFYEWRIEG
jgi:hypothetical protein